MAKVIIETTRFFRKHREMQEFADNMRLKSKYKVIGCGKVNDKSYYVKYRPQEQEV